MSSRSAWPDEYYEALRFYYWEPQWLNRHARAASGENRVEQVLKSLRAAEVSLNHILKFFFNLAPSALTARFLTASLAGWTPEHVETHISPKQDVAPGIDLCQTDILFEGTASRVALELKIGAKTSLDQIMKYAVFLRVYGGQSSPGRKMPYLLFMSPRADSFLPKGFDLFQTRAALEAAELKPTVARFAAVSGQSRAEIIEMAASLKLSQTTYGAFGAFLREELTKTEQTEGGETLRNLIGGTLAELSVRGLV